MTFLIIDHIWKRFFKSTARAWKRDSFCLKWDIRTRSTLAHLIGRSLPWAQPSSADIEDPCEKSSCVDMAAREDWFKFARALLKLQIILLLEIIYDHTTVFTMTCKIDYIIQLQQNLNETGFIEQQLLLNKAIIINTRFEACAANSFYWTWQVFRYKLFFVKLLTDIYTIETGLKELLWVQDKLYQGLFSYNLIKLNWKDY